MSQVEQAKYEVLTSQGNIEIRLYPPMIVAEAEVQGDRKTAISQVIGPHWVVRVEC